MSAITDIDDLVVRMSGGSSGTPEHQWFAKWGAYNGSSSGFSGTSPAVPQISFWQHDSIPGGPAAAPASGAIPDNTTAGGLQQANPGGGRQKWLLGADMFAGVGNVGQGAVAYLIYDRLFHIGGLSGTNTSAQSVQGAAGSESPALTRYTGGVGNFIMYEVYTAIGLTARTIRATYTDQAGNTGHLTAPTPIGGSSAAGNSQLNAAYIMGLASGDTGVRAVASVTLSATTGTIGNFGITIGHPLAIIPACGTGGPTGSKDGIMFPSITEILSNACLGIVMIGNGGGTVTPGYPIMGMTHTVEA